MPTKTEWTAPEIALEYHGVTVYHCYIDDDIDQGPMTYWFTCEELDPDGAMFDIREFDTPACRRLEDPTGHPPYCSGQDYEELDAVAKDYRRQSWEAHWLKEPGRIRQALREAIDAGLLDEYHVNATEGASAIERSGTG